MKEKHFASLFYLSKKNSSSLYSLLELFLNINNADRTAVETVKTGYIV